ncbi:MAG: hypothetical protein ACLTDC_02715 [Lachnospiraceae bacterium]
MISLVGCLPFYLSGEIPADIRGRVIFRAVSGFATTGASCVGLSMSVTESILFWRKFQSLDYGGMGALVLLLAITPRGRRFTSPEPDAKATESGAICGAKLVPKVRAISAYSLFDLFPAHDHLSSWLLTCLPAKMPFLDADDDPLLVRERGGLVCRNTSIGWLFKLTFRWVVAIFIDFISVVNFIACLAFY